MGAFASGCTVGAGAARKGFMSAETHREPGRAGLGLARGEAAALCVATSVTRVGITKRGRCLASRALQ